MTSACSTRPRQQVCPSTLLPDRYRRRGGTSHGVAWPRAVPSTGLSQDIGQPRASPDARPARSALSRNPVTSQVTTAPGKSSRRQTPSDGPIISISADPTRRDLAGRSHNPLPGYCGPPTRACSGAASGPLPGAIHVFHGFESLNQGISAGFQVTGDCHFSSHSASNLDTKNLHELEPRYGIEP